eukprot:CAMPEP_0183391138 /NCGR_PEP_ID=MMETSP0370-20130417/6251_1 /TAXON_ID=268820 /ORGANISM="Peridinium aciculiferum, Strain PAER-2" /LENGTH=277 /DNA_ID=CAMNT_0025570815 /DNA_START=56 /DNA_END=889 /DNA_ORIENTATION=-
MMRISQDTQLASAVAGGSIASPFSRPDFAAAAWMGQQQPCEEDTVIEFGAARKSDSDMISEMLAKLQRLDMPKPMAAVAQPQLTCLAPGLQASKGRADEQLSTTDESLSENSVSFETPPTSFEGTTSATDKKPVHHHGMTTLMIRNIPVAYTQDLLVFEWHQTANFDFLYLPKSTAGQMNMGYAFINFITEEDANNFKATWHKQCLAQFTSHKPLNISFADVQGIRSNVLQLKKKRVRCMEIRQCEPIILKGGRLVALAEAIESFTTGIKKGIRMSV